MMRKRQGNEGFSLIELMVTVAVVAIIAAVAIPSYRQYIRRANRTDATAALLRLAGTQERFYLQNNTYASNDQLDDDPPGGLGINGTERGFYSLIVDADPAGLDVGYTATATVVAGEDQEDDADCASFSVTSQGVRSAIDSGGLDNTEECWR